MHLEHPKTMSFAIPLNTALHLQCPRRSTLPPPVNNTLHLEHHKRSDPPHPFEGYVTSQEISPVSPFKHYVASESQSISPAISCEQYGQYVASQDSYSATPFEHLWAIPCTLSILRQQSYPSFGHRIALWVAQGIKSAYLSEQLWLVPCLWR